MKSVLMISPESWEAHTVSKHHYARTLAETGYAVYFLNPPDDSLSGISVKATDIPNLKIVTAPKVAGGLRFFPARIRNLLERRWLNTLETRIDRKIDIVWLFENSRFFDMRFAGDRLKLYHQVDLNQDFNVSAAAKTADVCIAVSNIIKNRLAGLNENVFKITHGTNEPGERLELGPSERQRFELPGKHVVYIGNIDIPCLDLKLLTQLVETFPAVNFHFVGGYSKQGEFWNVFNKYENIILWDKVHSDLIPSILDKADILLVIYKTDQWQFVANPHKFMEYFSSGKVIVSTYTDEYSDKRDLLVMTDDSEDYIKVFGEVLDNLDKYNSDELRATRMEFAKSHSYKHQLEKIFRIIRQSGFVLDEPEQV